MESFSITVGDTFPSYSNFREKLEEFQQETKTQFVTKVSQRLSKTDCLFEQFRYCVLRLGCKQGYRTKDHRNWKPPEVRPNQRTYKVNCPVLMNVRLNRPKDRYPFLKVTKLEMNHENHEISPEMFQLYPEQRRFFCDAVDQAILSSRTMKTSERRQALANRHGVTIKSQDVYNKKRKLAGECGRLDRVDEDMADEDRCPAISFCSEASDADKKMDTLDLVVNKLKKIAPLSLAGSWDNVGLLVEPSPPKCIRKVLLTNDLTLPVMEEAKDKIADLIISYHPPIFAKLKCLTQKNWKERIVIDCLENRIAVFSPHTSYDAFDGGVNDWLISAFDVDKASLAPIEATEELMGGLSHVVEAQLEPTQYKEFVSSVTSCLSEDSRIAKNKGVFSTHVLKSGGSGSEASWSVRLECNKSELADVIKGLVTSQWNGKYSILPLAKRPDPKTGMGRRATLKGEVSLDSAIEQVKKHLGLTHVSVAKAIGAEDKAISTVAVCAGSGSSVLRGVRADLLLTGEMSHHEVLDAVHNGSSVILCHHSNTERGYLKTLKGMLQKTLGSSIEIHISEVDKDPLEIV